MAERGVQGVARRGGGGVSTALADGVFKWQAVYKNQRKIPKKSNKMESQGKKPSHKERGTVKGAGEGGTGKGKKRKR